VDGAPGWKGTTFDVADPPPAVRTMTWLAVIISRPPQPWSTASPVIGLCRIYRNQPRH
jgi:hypothetical protein